MEGERDIHMQIKMRREGEGKIGVRRELLFAFLPVITALKGLPAMWQLPPYLTVMR